VTALCAGEPGKLHFCRAGKREKTIN
jgi:hypothetical protein